MPYRAGKLCAHPGCQRIVDTGNRYCTVHTKQNKRKRKRQPDQRESAAKRGYGSEWRKVREEVLQDWGIPKDQWSKYDVDHILSYDPDKEPDHRKYTLIPRVHSEHSKKTVKYDGGFGNDPYEY